jgi:hypothetical protein
VDDALSTALRISALATGTGVLLLFAVAAVVSLRAAARVPGPQEVRVINALTVGSMALAVAAILGSELLWRRLLSGVEAGQAGGAIRRAFMVRTATREAGALAGGVTALLAASSGVLRVYPAYWANLAPAALFLSYLWAHWPSVEKLRAELSGLPTA